MKKIYVLVLISVLFMGVGNIKYSKDDFITKDNKIYSKKDNTLVTGTVVKKGNNGTIELDIKEGVIQKSRKYYPNGKIKIEIDVLNNNIVEYFEDGKVAIENSEKLYREYFKNGKIEKEYFYEDNGKRYIEREYFISGEIKKESIVEGKIKKIIEVKEDERREYTLNLDTNKKIGKSLIFKKGVLRKSLNYNKNGELVGENIDFDEDGEITKKVIVGKDGELEYSFSTSSIFGDFAQERIRIDDTDKYLVKFIDFEGDEKRFIYENIGDISQNYKDYKEFIYDEYGLLQETNTVDKEKGHKILSKYENGFLISETVEIGGDENHTLERIYNNYSNEFVFLEEEKDTNGSKRKEIYPNGKIKYEIITTEENGESITVEKFYEPNGELALEIKNEKENIIDREFYEVKKYGGEYESYYENGKLAFKGIYSEIGGLIGKAEMFDENGTPVYRIEYEKNVMGTSFPKTLKLYYPDGKIKIEKEFSDIIPIVEKYYYSDGKLMAVNKRGDIRKGEYFLSEERYFPNGKSMGKTFYSNEENKILQGEYTRYYENGNPKKIFKFDDGVISEYKIYYENGKLKREIDFTKDTIYDYFSTGDLKEKVIIKEDGTEEKYTYWKNGKIKSMSYFENGEEIVKKFHSTGVALKDGNKKLHHNGKVAYEEIENRGKIIENTYYLNGELQKSKVDGVTTIFKEDGVKSLVFSDEETIKYSRLGEELIKELNYIKINEKNEEVKVHEIKEFDILGELISWQIYEDDKLVKDSVYNLWNGEKDLLKEKKEKKGENKNEK